MSNFPLIIWNGQQHASYSTYIYVVNAKYILMYDIRVFLSDSQKGVDSEEGGLGGMLRDSIAINKLINNLGKMG